MLETKVPSVEAIPAAAIPPTKDGSQRELGLFVLAGEFDMDFVLKADCLRSLAWRYELNVVCIEVWLRGRALLAHLK